MTLTVTDLFCGAGGSLAQELGREKRCYQTAFEGREHAWDQLKRISDLMGVDEDDFAVEAVAGEVERYVDQVKFVTERLTRERDEAQATAAGNEATLDTVTRRLAEALNLDEVPLDEMLFMVGNIVDERHGSVIRSAVAALESAPEQALASRPAIPADAVEPGLVNHIRPVKVSADRVEVEVSARIADGTTRAYVREWGRKGGCREVVLILTDEKRAELVSRLSAPVSGSGTAADGVGR